MQPMTRREWLRMHNAPGRKTVNRNIRKPPTPSVEIGEDALRVQARADERRSQMKECDICCEMYMPDYFRPLTNCGHAYCKFCTRRHITVSVLDNRVEVPCPGCGVDIHPDDVKRYSNQNPEFLAKYEQFSLRAALIKDPDARWCPAPDCGFAVIVPDGLKCPRIACPRPGCNTHFCFECKRKWHPGLKCAKEGTVRLKRDEVSACRPCPRCKTLIMKEDDGSCNHMHCSMCRAEFCWLCLKEITDLHYMTPSGCTFWGKKPWSGKRRLMWQLGSLVGSPLVIVATAAVSIPIITGMVPYTVGKKVYSKMKNTSKAKRVVTTAAAVTGTAIVSPVLAGVTVAVGIPLALGYTYTMVPKTIFCDVIDYVRKKKRAEIKDISPDELMTMTSSDAPPPTSSKSSSTSSETPPEGDRNADGSAPGPSSTASVTSSDYSEDFDSADFVVEVCDDN